MHLTYDKLSRQPRVFIRLTGVRVDTFQEIVSRMTLLLEC